jgi:hypothetical protein
MATGSQHRKLSLSDELALSGRGVIDLSAAHIWDASSVAAPDPIETKYAQRGKTAKIIA